MESRKEKKLKRKQVCMKLYAIMFLIACFVRFQFNSFLSVFISDDPVNFDRQNNIVVSCLKHLHSPLKYFGQSLEHGN